MKTIFVVVGAIVGLLIVRGFFFDTAEELGWRIFWDALFKGHVSAKDIGEVSGSATFAKSMLGLGVGAVLGFFTGKKLKD